MKNFLVEFLGTFFLTTAVAIASGNAWAVGTVLLALVIVGYHVSGGLYNPALVVASLGRKVGASINAPRYILAQLLGATAALVLFFYAFGVLFEHPMITEVAPWVLFVFEALLTALFVLVYLAVAGSKDAIHVGVAIGFTFAGIAFLGGLYNPAIALASIITKALFEGGVDKGIAWYALIYVGGPVFGAILAGQLHDRINK